MPKDMLLVSWGLDGDSLAPPSIISTAILPLPGKGALQPNILITQSFLMGKCCVTRLQNNVAEKDSYFMWQGYQDVEISSPSLISTECAFQKSV